MSIRYENKITADELNALPSGAVISFGDFCYEKLGFLWMRSKKGGYESEELTAAIDEKRVALEIRAIISLCRYKYSDFSIITPHDEKVFGKISWSESDVENAFEQLGYEMTAEKKAAVLNKVKPIIEDAMTSLGWSVIYDAVGEVCKDEDD